MDFNNLSLLDLSPWLLSNAVSNVFCAGSCTGFMVKKWRQRQVGRSSPPAYGLALNKRLWIKAQALEKPERRADWAELNRFSCITSAVILRSWKHGFYFLASGEITLVFFRGSPGPWNHRQKNPSRKKIYLAYQHFKVIIGGGAFGQRLCFWKMLVEG